MTDIGLYVEICLELGECYAQTGDLNAAHRNFVQAQSQAPENPRPYISLGQLALQADRWEQAQDFLARALELDERADSALSALGSTLLRSGKKVAAWDKFLRALEINSENQEALLGLAQAADGLENLSRAAERLQRHLQVHLVDFPVLLALAGVLAKMGKIPEAQEVLRKILLFDPANREALALEQELEPGTAEITSAPESLEPPGDSLSPSLIGRLNEIPSETDLLERIFLYQFFSRKWPGDGHVCEIGPFLGGTTRAIAMGMLANPHRQEHCRLYSVDRFHDYYDAGSLAACLQPLFRAGLLDDRLKKRLEANSTSFKEVFIGLHQHQPYFPLVVMQEQVLPHTPEETAKAANLFRLDPGLKFSAVFVDGCKSWYATKYFMSEISKCVHPGSHFLFQDYGWFSCFWIPAFLELCKDHFQLEACVKHTYTFRLTRTLDPLLIDRVFPDEPQALGKAFLSKLFKTLKEAAAARGDAYGMVFHTLQGAAGLAYLGYRQEAKALIMDLSRQTIARDHQELIQKCLKTPTYRPNGQVIELS